MSDTCKNPFTGEAFELEPGAELYCWGDAKVLLQVRDGLYKLCTDRCKTWNRLDGLTLVRFEPDAA